MSEQDPARNQDETEKAWAQAWASFEDEHGGFPGSNGALLHRARRRARAARTRTPFFAGFTSVEDCLEATPGTGAGEEASARP